MNDASLESVIFAKQPQKEKPENSIFLLAVAFSGRLSTVKLNRISLEVPIKYFFSRYEAKSHFI